MSENKDIPDYVEEIKNISIVLFLINELSHMLRNEYAKAVLRPLLSGDKLNAMHYFKLLSPFNTLLPILEEDYKTKIRLDFGDNVNPPDDFNCLVINTQYYQTIHTNRIKLIDVYNNPQEVIVSLTEQFIKQVQSK